MGATGIQKKDILRDPSKYLQQSSSMKLDFGDAFCSGIAVPVGVHLGYGFGVTTKASSAPT